MCLFADASWKETRWEKSAARNRASQNAIVSRYTISYRKMAGNDWIADRSVQQLFSLSFSSTDFYIVDSIAQTMRQNAQTRYFAFFVGKSDYLNNKTDKIDNNKTRWLLVTMLSRYAIFSVFYLGLCEIYEDKIYRQAHIFLYYFHIAYKFSFINNFN